MTAYLARADGAPGPTLVLDRSALPSDEPALLAELARLRGLLRRRVPGPEVLKLAVIGPSAHPLYDLDYRFVQALPGGDDRFDLRGNCGHSILAALLAAGRTGLLPRPAPGQRVRVNVLNNGDQVVCEVDAASRAAVDFTAHFLCPPGTRLGSLLPLAGATETVLELPAFGPVRGSLVAMGNPYVFVDATDLGVRSRAGLFREDPRLAEALAALRAQAADRLGWPVGGAFPKVAAVLPGGEGAGRAETAIEAAADAIAGGLPAVRALTVPGWHPGLALTGAVCLAAASAMRGTVPNRLLGGGGAVGEIAVETPSGPVAASCAATGDGPEDLLRWVSVPGKRARALGPVDLPGPGRVRAAAAAVDAVVRNEEAAA